MKNNPLVVIFIAASAVSFVLGMGLAIASANHLITATDETRSLAGTAALAGFLGIVTVAIITAIQYRIPKATN